MESGTCRGFGVEFSYFVVFNPFFSPLFSPFGAAPVPPLRWFLKFPPQNPGNSSKPPQFPLPPPPNKLIFSPPGGSKTLKKSLQKPQEIRCGSWGRFFLFPRRWKNPNFHFSHQFSRLENSTRAFPCGGSEKYSLQTPKIPIFYYFSPPPPFKILFFFFFFNFSPRFWVFFKPCQGIFAPPGTRWEEKTAPGSFLGWGEE